MGVMALFTLQKMLSFRYFLKKKIGVLDSYFIHRYIIIKYRSFDLAKNPAIIMRVMALFST